MASTTTSWQLSLYLKHHGENKVLPSSAGGKKALASAQFKTRALLGIWGFRWLGSQVFVFKKLGMGSILILSLF